MLMKITNIIFLETEWYTQKMVRKLLLIRREKHQVLTQFRQARRKWATHRFMVHGI